MPFDLPFSVHFWYFRIAGYLLVNVMEDPAWLALIFC